MQCLFKAADAYIKKAGWRDLALIKCCLAAMGVLIGLSIPKRTRKLAGIFALLVFVGTYVPLMFNFLNIFKTHCIEQEIEL